jgi:integrase
MKLTAKTITALILPPGKSDVIHFDDDLPRFGYRLRDASDGKILRSWIVQYKKAGRSARVRIGDAGAITAEAARAEARRILARVDLGEDPAADRRDRREKDRYSLRSVIDEYLETRRPPQTDRERKDKKRLRPKSYREVRRYLLDTFRPLHSTPVDRLTRKDIAFHLARIKRERGVSVEGCARAALNTFFSWAMTMGLIEHNPVIGTPMPGRAEPRSRVLSDEELVAIWRACQDDDFGRIIKLLILLGARRQEVGGMTWDELSGLDGPQPTWVLPSERSKNHRAHTLPLMPMALDIIRAVPRMASRRCLFGVHSDKGFAAWDKGHKALVERSGVHNWLPHDIRRSFSTKLHDLGVEPHIVEALLNHYSGHRASSAGVYNLAKYLPQMRNVLALWERYVALLLDRDLYAAHERLLASGDEEARDKASEAFRDAITRGGGHWADYLHMAEGGERKVVPYAPFRAT